MDISQAALAWLYLYALLLGIGLGLVYDLLRITRVFLGAHYSRRAARRLQEISLPLLRARKKKTESRALGLVIFLEDLLFCLFAAVAIILLFYEANRGKIRFPALLCVGVGFLLYRSTLGRLVMLFSEVIAFAIETAGRYLCFFAFLPIRLLRRWIGKQFKQAHARVLLVSQSRSRQRYTVQLLARADRDACGLIPEELSKDRKRKRGRVLETGKKNTIQSHASDSNTSRRSGGRFHRNICK